MRNLRAWMLACCLVAWVGQGRAAADVIYGLAGVTLSDGATVSGYLTLNAYGFLGMFDIVTTSGPVVGGYEYTPTTPGTIFGGNLLVVARAGYVGELHLLFALPLDPQVNANPVVIGPGSYECDDYLSPGGCSGQLRLVTGGMAVAEPGTALVLAAGLLGLGMLAGRRGARAGAPAGRGYAGMARCRRMRAALTFASPVRATTMPPGDGPAGWQ